MKKTILSALILATLFTVKAQTVTEDSFSRLAFSVKTPSVAVDGAVVGSGKYLQLVVEGYSLTGNVGDPALPVLTQTIVLPFCSDMSISVSNAVYDTIQADASLQWYPYQPSVSKSDRGPLALYFNKDSYLLDTFFSLPLVQVTDIAVARDRRIATLTIAPVSLNPVTNQYIVCRSADVSIDYHGVDTAMTNDYYERYHTPSFSVNGKFNDLADASSPKVLRTSAPLTMTVVVPTSLNCSAVARFVDWKRRCGMRVNVVYYGTGSITSNTALAAYLKSLYDNASLVEPAPTYVLLVGDNEQLPAFSSRVPTVSYPDNDHITDLYYVTWSSGDNVPDCFQGRLSASDTNSLTAIINKTLLYEMYAFPDPSYLAKAILISGVDYYSTSDNAYRCSDPTMDYAARYYVTADNGYTNVKYYKNNTSFAPTGVTVTGSSQSTSTASTLRNLYNAGAGWVNYSAHGNWNEWSIPKFTVTNVNSMANNNKPMFMIGNCCLTNKFDQSVCFGEALLRKGNNGGAVAYIGGTNSTYWDQDFYWSVGIRSGINNTMNATYDPSNLGIYDRLFHTHGESRNNQAITAGAIVFYGNSAVHASGSSDNNMKKYYWEIYELMGDPSLMPWLGPASDLTEFSYERSASVVQVTTVADAYVALVDTVSHNLVAAAYANSGTANLTVPEDVNLEACSFVVIAQGYKPYFSVEMQPLLNLDKVDAEFSLYPNPASDRCTVVADSIATVVLLDNRGTVVSTFKPAGNTCDIDLSALPRGIYFVQVQTADNMSARKLVVR